MLEINAFDSTSNIKLRRERAFERALYNMRYLDSLQDSDKAKQNKAVEESVVDIVRAIERSITGDDDELKASFDELLNDLRTILHKEDRGESVYFLGKHTLRKWLFSLEDLRKRANTLDVMSEHGVNELTTHIEIGK